MDDVERTLPASERRRAWAREQGYSARSAAFTAALSLTTVAALWLWSGSTVVDQLASRLSLRLSGRVAMSLDLAQAVDLIRDDVFAIGVFGVWVTAAVWATAAGVNLLQAGFQWSPAAVAPDLSRVDPAQGWRRLIGVDNAIAAVWSLVVIGAAVVGGIVVFVAWPAASVTGGTLETRVRQLNEGLAMAAIQVAALVAVTCLLDVLRRRWSLERSLRMTLEEQREEAGRRPVTRRGRK